MDEVEVAQKLITSEEYLPKNIFLEICVCVLQEALDQLFIMKKINQWPDDDETSNYEYLTLEERFSEKLSKNRVDINLKTENAVTLFQRNCAFIESLFRKLFNELKNEGCYHSFSNIVNSFIMMKSDEESLLQEAEEKERQLRTLKNTFYEVKESYIRKIMECMANTGKIKDKLEDFDIESRIKLKYITAWENSKTEMNDITFARKQQELQEKIKCTDLNIGQEARVNQEIINVFNEIQKDFDTTIDKWKMKYSKDLSALNNELDVLQKKQDKQLEEIARMKDLYARRQKQIEDYKEYKIEQEKKRLEMEKRVKAATKIQAWWRGTMVRKGFGKYRKKKEKKGKKKSSEKGKKNDK